MPELLEQVQEEILVPMAPAPIEGQLAPSPYNFEFTGEDQLALTVHNSLAGVRVAVHWRMKPRRGPIIANRQEFTPATDRSASSLEFGIGEGYLLNLVAFASAGSPRRGQTFVRVRVIRGRDASAVALGSAIQGYVTGNQDRAWPGSPLEGSLEGDGYIRAITGTNPAAGSELSETVPTGARWEVMALLATLVTDATATNRRPTIRLDDGASHYFQVGAPDEWGANTTQEVCWASGAWLTTTIDPDSPLCGFPQGIVLLAGHRIRTNTRNFQAGDNWSAPLFVIREWLEAQ